MEEDLQSSNDIHLFIKHHIIDHDTIFYLIQMAPYIWFPNFLLLLVEILDQIPYFILLQHTILLSVLIRLLTLDHLSMNQSQMEKILHQ